MDSLSSDQHHYDQSKKIEELKRLIENNTLATKQLQQSFKKIRRFILWSQIFTWLRVIVIILAILGSYIYFGPLINKFLRSYSQIIQTITGAKLDANSVTSPELKQAQDLLSGYKNKLKQ